MLAKELVVGQSYVAKVSGRLTTVRLDQVVRTPGRTTATYRRNASTHYHCVNEKTGRQVTLKSALKFRRVAVLQPASASSQTVQLSASELVACAKIHKQWVRQTGKPPKNPFMRIRKKLCKIRDGSPGMNSVAKIHIMRTCDVQFSQWGKPQQDDIIRQVLAE